MARMKMVDGIIVKMSDDEISKTDAEAAQMLAEHMALLPARVRDQRNKMLAASDWTQVPDAPVDRAAWADYRQALRDLSKQEGFPDQVVWPVPPA